MPYVEGLAPQLKRRLENHGIRTVFRSDSTLRKQLVHPKDPVPILRQDGVVYSIPCKGCDGSYIGETYRPLGERIVEHRGDVRNRHTEESAVAEHMWEEDHRPDWEGVHCLDKERHAYTRKVKESINIRLTSHTFNRNSGGIDIPDFWLRIIKRHRRPPPQANPAEESQQT